MEAETPSAKTGSSGAGDRPYRVLARKYRPQDFSDLIGQEPMVRTLSNAFETGRIAQAYMLTGVRGVGKTTTARILARALNYKRGEIDRPTIDLSEPGEHCEAIIEGRHVDIIEMDAASHTGIDDIRDLIEAAQYRPVSARYKVYIIDEVHMLSKSAFNGLLKTLEEPPAHLKFVFATTEIRKVPITVLSRCQRFDLRRIEAGTLSEHLNRIAGLEGVEIEPDALSLLSRAAEGSVRDSLSMLDQAIAHSAGKVEAETVRAMLGLADRARVIDLFEHLMKGDVGAALEELKSQHDIGAEPEAVLTDLADFIHYVTKLKYVPKAAEDMSLSEVERKRGEAFAQSLNVRQLGRAWQLLLKGITEVQASDRPLAAADMVLVRMAHAATLPTPDELIKRLENGGGTPASGGPGKAAATGSNGAGSTAISSGVMQQTGLPQPPGQAATRMATGMGGPVLASSNPSPEPVSEVLREDAAPLRVLNKFDDLIFLVEDMRDLQLKTCLRRNVSLVHFEDGRMDVHIVGNPPPTFLPDLTRKLHDWTGRRWSVSTSREMGAPTLEQVEIEEDQTRKNDARTVPAVEAVLKAFPGAKIVDVKVNTASLDGSQSDELSMPMDAPDEVDNDPLAEDGLDDFFE